MSVLVSLFPNEHRPASPAALTFALQARLLLKPNFEKVFSFVQTETSPVICPPSAVGLLKTKCLTPPVLGDFCNWETPCFPF